MKVNATDGPPPGQARAKGPSIQELLDDETLDVPWVLRQERYEFMGDEDLPADRYFSQEFFEREVDKLWPKVWQLACFEQDIPNVGDTIVYDIVDWSFLIVRVAPDRIKAFYNACLHRGRQLRTNDCAAARLPELRCPFHGLAWHIDGSFKEVPPSIAFDFPHIDPPKFGLPEVQCETWDGIVFINMDPNAEPLRDFLGDLTKHFERWPFNDRWKAAHVAKVMHANWKVTLEAFLESMHVITTHPQMNAGLLGGDGSNCEYDVYENFSRSIMAPPMPNPNLPYEVTEQELIAEMFNRGGVQTEGGYQPQGDAPELPDGMTARGLLAEVGRQQGNGAGGGAVTVAGSPMTVVEATSSIWYNVFPNWFPWSGPIFYRFRPYGHDPDKCIMECIFMVALPAGTERPPAAAIHWLSEDEDWTAAPELGALAEIFNQDTANIPQIQRGLKSLAHGKPTKGITLANYQDVRIRHFHKLIDKYLDA
uniref:aromatic ring-hydroxylating oxygenase subunit alpha n=1 Tax=Mycobacterium sp. OAE908 TaxID=2817899 RepID=UPI0034E1DF1D